MSASLRVQVRQRAEFCCEYCQMLEEFDALVFQWDHIIAQKHGGSTDMMNLAWTGPVLVAKTPIGRVTLYVLGINLPHRLAFRQLLIDEGVFP